MGVLRPGVQERTDAVLLYTGDYYREHGYPPTVREIGAGTGRTRRGRGRHMKEERPEKRCERCARKLDCQRFKLGTTDCLDFDPLPRPPGPERPPPPPWTRHA